jgi:type IV pilus biogenesis protein CpaD/CtpE
MNDLRTTKQRFRLLIIAVGAIRGCSQSAKCPKRTIPYQRAPQHPMKRCAALAKLGLMLGELAQLAQIQPSTTGKSML